MKSRGLRHAAALLAILGAATITFSLFGQPAAADPPVPAAADPVTSVLSPVADEFPACGQLTLGLIVVDVAVQALTTAAGPALAVGPAALLFGAYDDTLLTLLELSSPACDAIPARQFDTTCDADDQVTSALASVPAPGLPALPVDAVGLLPVPTEPGLVGAFVDVIAALERAAAAEAGASAAAAEPLGCETVERVASTPAPGGLTGDIDLTSPVAKGPLAATGATSGSPVASATKAPASRRPSPATDGGAVAAAPTSSPTKAAAAPAAAVTSAGDSSTRRNVYRVAFLLTAAAAAVGLASPRKKKVDPTP